MRSRPASSSATRPTSSSTFNAQSGVLLHRVLHRRRLCRPVARLATDAPHEQSDDGRAAAECVGRLRSGRLEGDAELHVEPGRCATNTRRRTGRREPFPNVNLDTATGQLVRATDDNRYLVEHRQEQLRAAARVRLSGKAREARRAWRVRRVLRRRGVPRFGRQSRDEPANMLIPVQCSPSAMRRRLLALRSGAGASSWSQCEPGQLGPHGSAGPRSRSGRGDAAPVERRRGSGLPLQSTLEIAYVGNRGRNLPGTYQANQTPFGVDGSVPANRPLPDVGHHRAVRDASRVRSTTGLQTKFEHRFNARLVQPDVVFVRSSLLRDRRVRGRQQPSALQRLALGVGPGQPDAASPAVDRQHLSVAHRTRARDRPRDVGHFRVPARGLAAILADHVADRHSGQRVAGHDRGQSGERDKPIAS